VSTPLQTSFQRVKPAALIVTLLRFAPTTVFMVISAFLSLGMHNEWLADHDTLLISSNLLIILLTTLRLFKESHDLKPLTYWASVFGTIAFILYAAHGGHDAPYFLTLGALAAITIAPLSSQNPEATFLNHNLNLFYSVLFAIAATLILFGGVSLMLYSIDYLFNLEAFGEFYVELGYLCFYLLLPSLILSNLNPNTPHTLLLRSLTLLITYILVPLLSLYGAILYAYFAKILLSGALPKGNLSIMIIFFGSVGIFTLLLIRDLKDPNPLLKRLQALFFPILLLPIGMLIFAITVRIQEYGLTEARYAVVLFALWFSFVTLNALIKRKTPSAPITLWGFALLFFLSTIGPFSADKLASTSQYNRLITLLEQEKLLNNGTISPATQPISYQSQKQIYSILYHFYYQDPKLNALLPLFDAQLKKKGYQEPTVTNLLAILNIRPTPEKLPKPIPIKDHETRFVGFAQTLPNITGYHHMGHLSMGYRDTKELFYTLDNTPQKARFTLKGWTLHYQNGEHETTFDLHEYFYAMPQQNTFFGQHEAYLTKGNITIKIMHFEFTKAKVLTLNAYVLFQ